MTDHPLITAPCGCTSRGRFVSDQHCTDSPTTKTGAQRMRHTVAALKRITRKV